MARKTVFSVQDVLGGAVMKLALSGAALIPAMLPVSAAQQNVAATANAGAHPAGASGPKTPVLEIRALDKITGHASVLYAPLNKPVHYETLTITARKCYSTPPDEPPQTSAFLEVTDHRPGRPEHQVFSGWMYSSSPGLNAMEHPLYDVWVVNCSASAPVQAVPQTEVTVSPQDATDDDVPDESGKAPSVPDDGDTPEESKGGETGH